ncbi:hypothetical protein M378DRAFT_74956 [Amanita muscaria Koide BX008]|uniref:Peroxisomal biogenesis factor 3 n=1 Tax=Amanita muscaria (strain Koide BX008) TaxID=946122 RepID=A0A0C2XCP5_AMAMK|nr:hypothetical protein M378DRAFT_74956 [Amanita muscaria Koide BX008]
MIQSLKSYVYDKRKGLAKTAGFVGGAYLLQRYVSDRLAELKAKLDEERIARESLRRRFQTAADDVSFTVLAVLPTLAEQIMEGMDVEALTQELQTRSKARVVPGLVDTTSEQSEVGSTASTSFIEAPSQDGQSSGMNSWIETSASGPSFGSSSFSGVDGASSPHHPPNLSDSVITSNTTTTESSSGGNEGLLSDSVTSMSAASDSTASKTKAELWAEVKMLTFRRTLTTFYSMTLLSLLTTIQLNILARFKYINSVLEFEREERLQEQLQSHLDLSFTDLLFKDASKIQDLLSRDMSDLHDDAEKGEIEGDVITEEVERKFLTLSWWILHVGWKDVGERVRRGVEEVFEGVSLKTKLAAIDLHRLVRDVRRRVEHEITFEGQERRVNFLSTLLPPTPEMIQHVLTQGGFIPESPLGPYTVRASEQATQDTTTLTSSQLSHEFDASPATGLSGLFNNPNNPHNVAPLPSSSSQPLIPNSNGANEHDSIDYASITGILPSGKQRFRPRQQSHPNLNSDLNTNSPMLLHAVHDPLFISLIEETRAVIKSPDFEHVLEACLDRATAVLFDGLEKNVFVSSETAPGEEVRIRLAGLLPGLTRWSRLALNGIPNELVDNVLGLREVTCLSAIVFSKFEERSRNSPSLS